jgi:undecaprenyl phosphate N,N'-diacetylbacillosamine 1-phosphate transferase
MLLIAAAVRLDSPGPALFRQDRVGRGGRVFTLYKFRSMKRGAKPLRRDDGSSLVHADDERFTRVGKLIRCGLDELPQLWNVLKGDMSLVGPRPDEPDHVRLYTERDRTKLTVLPGITGMPQVSGRNTIPWKERIAIDLEYIQKRSLLLDLKILLRTVSEVLPGAKGNGETRE